MRHISTMYARFIARELELDDLTLKTILGDDGVNVDELFSQPHMPYEQFFRFVSQAKKLRADDALGLKVGSRLTPMSLGELGQAMLSAPNLFEALNLAVNFGKIDTPYIELNIKATMEGVYLTHRELADLGDTSIFQTEVFASVSQALIEAIICQPFREGRFCFAYDRPAHAETYAHFLHSDVRFSCDTTAIILPHEFCKRASPYHNAQAWNDHQMKLLRQFKQLSDYQDKAFSLRVNDYLTAHPPPLPNASQTAQHLHVSERTLCRRLSLEGKNFRAIRNNALIQLAQNYLEESDYSVDSIACQLGFQDNSSFRRAFKRELGMSPQQYREKIKTG